MKTNTSKEKQMENEKNELQPITSDTSMVDFEQATALLGLPTSFADYVRTLEFAVHNPQLGEIIARLPQLEGRPGRERLVAQYVQNMFASFKPGATSSWFPTSLGLIKDNQREEPFKLGTFEIKGNKDEAFKEILFLPLVYYTKRVYYKPYDPNNKDKGVICSSANGFEGIYNGPDELSKKALLKCKDCNFKEWGCDPSGTINQKNRTKPLCGIEQNFLGVTPALDGIYQLRLNGYCTGKDFKADKELKLFGRVYPPFIPAFAIGTEEAKSYTVENGIIDKNSTWVSLTGRPIKDKEGKKIVSAGTVVTQTQKTLSNQELVYALVYQKLSQEYMTAMLQKFKDRIAATFAGPSDAELEDAIEVTNLDDTDDFAGVDGKEI